jgi:hypothetical protein
LLVISFQLCFGVHHQEDPGTTRWLENKWFTSALVYADCVNRLGGSVQNIEENAEGLVIAGKKIGLAVNADKTKYMVMSLKGWNSSNI